MFDKMVDFSRDITIFEVLAGLVLFIFYGDKEKQR